RTRLRTDRPGAPRLEPRRWFFPSLPGRSHRQRSPCRPLSFSARVERMTREMFRLTRSRPPRPRSTRRLRLQCEPVQARDVPSVNLRIATYNIGNGVRSGLDTVLHAIGDQVVNGDARPVDVLALQETDQGLSDVQQVTGLLNGIYGAGAYTWSTTVG